MKCYKPPEFHQPETGVHGLPQLCPGGFFEVVETVFEDPNEATD